jgi:hypothetical protein
MISPLHSVSKTMKLFHVATWSAGPKFVMQSCCTSHGTSFASARNFTIFYVQQLCGIKLLATIEI